MVDEIDEKNDVELNVTPPEDTGEPAPIPDDADVSHTRQAKGLTNDLQGERQQRHAAERRAEAAEAELAQTQEKVTAQDEFDDDDVPTFAQTKQLIVNEQAKVQAAAEQKQQEDNRRRTTQAEARARAEFTTESQGKGLDYDTVMREGMAELGRSEHDMAAVMASADPAREAYQRAIMLTPDLQKRQEEARTAKLVDRMASRSGRPAGGGASGLRDLEVQQAESQRLLDTTQVSDSDLLKAIQEATAREAEAAE